MIEIVQIARNLKLSIDSEFFLWFQKFNDETDVKNIKKNLPLTEREWGGGKFEHLNFEIRWSKNGLIRLSENL